MLNRVIFECIRSLRGIGGPGDPKQYGEMAKRLLDGGADPDVWSADGSVTPIHVAAEFGQTEVVIEIMKDGGSVEKRLRPGNVNLRDGRGRTAATIATEHKMTDLASLLSSSQVTQNKRIVRTKPMKSNSRAKRK